MAKVQTRRSISFNRDLFALVAEAAASEGKSASQWVAELASEKLRADGKTPPVQHFAGPKRDAEEGASGG